jgi:hypothetical protein
MSPFQVCSFDDLRLGSRAADHPFVAVFSGVLTLITK